MIEEKTIKQSPEWKQVYALVNTFFNDERKTTLWLETDNPLLGNISPLDMIHAGRTEKLLQFIETAFDENPK